MATNSLVWVEKVPFRWVIVLFVIVSLTQLLLGTEEECLHYLFYYNKGKNPQL